jgi:hypothetical protein
MNAPQLVFSILIYAVAIPLVARLVRATRRRLVGALVGGVAIAAAAMPLLDLGGRLGWWTIRLVPPANDALVFLSFATAAPVFPLISWRVARRWGGAGLAAMTALAALLGPPRDAAWVAMFPEWMSYGPGPAPYLAVAAFYAGAVVIGHAAMTAVAGPSAPDPLADRPRPSRGAA